MLARTMRKDFIFDVASKLGITSNNVKHNLWKILVPQTPCRHFSCISAVHAGSCIDFNTMTSLMEVLLMCLPQSGRYNT